MFCPNHVSERTLHLFLFPLFYNHFCNNTLYENIIYGILYRAVLKNKIMLHEC